MEIEQLDREEIARQIEEGYTSGIIDSDGFRISWELKADKFEN